MLKSGKTFLLLLTAFCSAQGQPAAQKSVDQYRDSLNRLAHVMQRGENDSARFASAAVYNSIVNFLLTDSSSFNASFDSIPNLSVRTSSDHLLRTYTWMTSNYQGNQYRFFGFVQWKKNKKVLLYPLTDSTESVDKPLSRKLKADHWYGAIYYSIIPCEQKGKKFYALLGWKGKDESFTQKVIDAVSFDSGKPVFGMPVFKASNIFNQRVIFEFTSQAVMSLKYMPERKTIVFDHIGRSALTGVIGPDGTYDAFRYVKDHWEFVEDVDVDNGFIPKKKDVKLFKDDQLKKEEK